MPTPSKYSLICVAITGALLAGCGESTSSSAGADYGNQDNTTSDFDQTALLTNLVDGVITPTFEQFVSVSEQQQAGVDAYCTVAVGFEQGNNTQAELTSAQQTAQQNWRGAMSVWQQVEMMQLGPLLDDDGALRNKIYSWLVVSRCGVDLDVVSFETGNINGVPYDIANRTPARKGLVALEYLLFNSNLDHSCTESVTPDGWNNRTEADRIVARCEFAAEIAGDIHNNAQALVTEWSAADGYAAALKNAGQTGSEFDDVHQAVNKVSDALFYIDSVTKDGKLATPLGLFANSCGTSVCPEDVESPLAFHSIENIASNLQALQSLYSGNEGVGFDDYLVDENDVETAETLTANIQSAITNVQAYESSLAQTLTDNEQQVTDTHAEVKSVTDQLKNDFINSLALELPQTSAGDND